MDGHERTVSVTEAATALGVSNDAIRKRLSRGTIAGEKVAGQWRVIMPDTVPDVSHTPGAPGTDTPPDTLASVIADLASQNAQLAAAAAMWQERARHLEEKLLQLSPGDSGGNEAVGSSVRDETGTTGISTHGDHAAPRASMVQRVWRALVHRG